MTDYDKELINSRIIEICDYYAPGESWREGQNRRKWYCPVCDGDNFTASTQKQCAGCLSAGCEVPRTKDAVGLIVYFEGLQNSGQDFVRALKKGYEILGIPEPEDSSKPKKRSSKPRSVQSTEPETSNERPPDEPEPAGQSVVSDPEPVAGSNGKPQAAARSSLGTVTATGATAGSLGLLHALQHGLSPDGESLENGSDAADPKEDKHVALDPQQHRELVDQVYKALLEICPLIDRDKVFWTSRGVGEEMMEQCGFGSLSRDRCHDVLPKLERRFSREAMTSVPGFYESEQGRLHTNLYDDYTLIPYYDRDGYITMVQGRVPGTPEEGKPKYKAPINSGLHLYVPPGYKPEQVMAFCEGAVAAIVAAQSGIPVAAITGYQNYRIAGEKGESDRPLPEHAKTVFGGRKVLYIPDEDVKPKTKESVKAEAPKAARFLIENHGGTAYIAQLPEGYTDLDEWLLDLDPDQRIPKFAELMQGAMTPEQWEVRERPTDDDSDSTGKEDNTEDGGNQTEPESQEIIGQSQNDTISSSEVRQSKERNGGKDDSSEGSGNEEDSHEESGEEDTEGGGDGEEDGKTVSSPGLIRREPKPRRYRPIPRFNLGEFMVSLLYGLAAAVAFFSLIVFAAPEWGPTSFMAGLPVVVTLAVSLVIVAAVLAYMSDRLYWRRWRALRDHLAGNRIHGGRDATK